jgi:hypothetical protein
MDAMAAMVPTMTVGWRAAAMTVTEISIAIPEEASGIAPEIGTAPDAVLPARRQEDQAPTEAIPAAPARMSVRVAAEMRIVVRGARAEMKPERDLR